MTKPVKQGAETSKAASGFIPPMPERQSNKLPIVQKWLKARQCLLAAMPEKSYSMKLGHIGMPFGDIYTVCELSLVKRILVTNWDRFPKSRKLQAVLAPLLGNGSIISSGNLWTMQRRMIDPAFAHARLQVVFPLMVAAVETMFERLDKLPDGEVIAVDAESAHVTADTIFRTIFSEPLSGDTARRVFHGFMAFQTHATSSWAIGVAGLPTFLSPATYRARAAGRAIRAELEALVRPRFADWKRTGKSDRQDILTSLLAAEDPETGHVFDFRELVDQIATLFLAGHETTASSLAWALHLSAACPHVQERLHAEAVEVFGDRQPRFTDIKKLRFARDVFRETLRLYPSLPFIPRENQHEEQMRNKTIKAGSTIAVAPWLIHRHRDFWDRPDEFDPDRFTTPKGKNSLRCAYLPFSQGPRVCLGAAFAMQEGVLILASLLRRYRFETGPELTPKPVGRLTLRSEEGIRLKIFKR